MFSVSLIVNDGGEVKFVSAAELADEAGYLLHDLEDAANRILDERELGHSVCRQPESA